MPTFDIWYNCDKLEGPDSDGTAATCRSDRSGGGEVRGTREVPSSFRILDDRDFWVALERCSGLRIGAPGDRSTVGPLWGLIGKNENDGPDAVGEDRPAWLSVDQGHA